MNKFSSKESTIIVLLKNNFLIKQNYSLKKIVIKFANEKKQLLKNIEMIVFPNIKINIGLNIISKREGGYHNIETVFYPLTKPSDVLEVIEKNSAEDKLTITGFNVDGDLSNNLVLIALKKLREIKEVPFLNIHLHKIIPAGSGLGGGSSNAAFMLRLVNRKFNLGINNNKLLNIASTIGADCSVFIENRPVFAEGIGNIFHPISLSLFGYWIQIIIPLIHVSTANAYSNITPQKPEISLVELIKEPIENWKELIFNDFEQPIFAQHNELSDIKSKLYNNGAIYASMSGSGSSIYGIFKNKPEIVWDSHFTVFTEQII